MKTWGACRTRTVKIGPYSAYQCSRGGSGSWERRWVRRRLKLVGPGGYPGMRCSSLRSAYTRAAGLAVTYEGGVGLDTVLAGASSGGEGLRECTVRTKRGSWS